VASFEPLVSYPILSISTFSLVMDDDAVRLLLQQFVDVFERVMEDDQVAFTKTTNELPDQYHEVVGRSSQYEFVPPQLK
jgi:hypothetical protein